jgi:hypothetical protein
MLLAPVKEFRVCGQSKRGFAEFEVLDIGHIASILFWASLPAYECLRLRTSSDRVSGTRHNLP